MVELDDLNRPFGLSKLLNIAVDVVASKALNTSSSKMISFRE